MYTDTGRACQRSQRREDWKGTFCFSRLINIQTSCMTQNAKSKIPSHDKSKTKTNDAELTAHSHTIPAHRKELLWSPRHTTRPEPDYRCSGLCSVESSELTK